MLKSQEPVDQQRTSAAWPQAADFRAAAFLSAIGGPTDVAGEADACNSPDRAPFAPLSQELPHRHGQLYDRLILTASGEGQMKAQAHGASAGSDVRVSIEMPDKPIEHVDPCPHIPSQRLLSSHWKCVN